MEQTSTCLQNQNTAGRSNFRSLSIGSVPLSNECCLISQSPCQELDSAELTDMTVPCLWGGPFLSLGSWQGTKGCTRSGVTFTTREKGSPSHSSALGSQIVLDTSEKAV